MHYHIERSHRGHLQETVPNLGDRAQSRAATASYLRDLRKKSCVRIIDRGEWWEANGETVCLIATEEVEP
jgi:hypothetical protein